MIRSKDSTGGQARDSLIEPPSRPAQLALLLYLLAALAYLGWRATTLNPSAPIFSWLLYAAEWLAFAVGLLQLFTVVRLRRRPRLPAAAGLGVDLLVLAGREPVERIRQSLLAARNIDYPHATWLLDGQDRAELRALAAELGLRYLHDDKASSANALINRALQLSSAAFIAIFEVDHAPKRDFLDASLGHFGDPAVAFVQTAQDFLNLDARPTREGGLAQRSGQSLFFRVIQPGRDAWNAALYCGSCAVFRRTAIEAIGGFPPDRPGADLETSLAIHKAGLQSVYVAEALAFGVAPSTVAAVQARRRRRDRGALRLLLRERLFLHGPLSLPQRLNYLAGTLGSLDGWQQALCYAAPVWMLLTGSLPLVASLGLFLALFLPYQTLRLLAEEETRRGHGRRRLIAAQNMARFISLMRAGQQGLQRTAPATPPDAMTEPPEPALGSLPLPGLLPTVWPQLLVAGVNLFALLFGLTAWLKGDGGLPFDGLLAAGIWASLNVGIALQAMRRALVRADGPRQARRFAIPLPALVVIDGSEIPMTVDNISVGGARMYGDFPNRLKIGDALVGELFLPGESLSFSGRVVALRKPDKPSEDGQYHAALGISLQWPDRATEDRLGLFLYGSDLDWQFRHPDLPPRTPSERIAGLFDKPPVDPLAGKHWATIRYDADGEIGHGLISVASSPGPRVVVTSHPLTPAEPLQASKFSRRQPQGLRIMPRRELAQLSTPTSTLYLTEVKAAPMLEPMRDPPSASSTPMLPPGRYGAAPS